MGAYNLQPQDAHSKILDNYLQSNDTCSVIGVGDTREKDPNGLMIIGFHEHRGFLELGPK